MPNGNWKECPIRGTLKIYSEIKILGFADDERSDEETYMKKYGKKESKDAGWKLNEARIRRGRV